MSLFFRRICPSVLRSRPVYPLARKKTVQWTALAMQSSSSENTTHFGFRQVFEAEKERLGKNSHSFAKSQAHRIMPFTVGKVFTDVASKYDMMNDLMSLGIHRCWKDTFVERLHPTPGMKLLDCAGGTGNSIRLHISCHIL